MAEPEPEHGPTTVYDVLVASARSGLEIQREDGSFPPGRNYTYDEPETPVRTTSHWLRTLTKAYEISGDPVFEDAANLAIDYLLRDELRPSGATYHCRKVDSKDKCNGLVGQAAPIWALARASEVLDRQDAWTTAEEVFQLHPFSERLGLWERVEIDGSNISFDRTLNHQIIFAAACSQLVPGSELATERVERFLNALGTNMETRPDGLIKHYVHPPLSAVISAVARSPHRYNMLLNEVASIYHTCSDERRKKERGYQSINFESLAALNERFPELHFWESDVFSRSLEFLLENESEIIEGVRTKHGDQVPGITIAKARHQFRGSSTGVISDLIESELVDDLESTPVPLDTADVDKSTGTALVSRLTGLPDVELNNSDVR